MPFGKPTIRKPAPKPTPCLAPAETAGDSKSRTEKVHAAVKANIKISLKSNLLFGNMRATKATIRPSKAYLRSRITTSQKSTVYSISIILLLRDKIFSRNIYKIYNLY